MPIIETGHAKNVANFEDLILFVTGYGATYNPTKVPIKLASLNTLFTTAKADVLLVTTKTVAFNNYFPCRITATQPPMICFSLLCAIDYKCSDSGQNSAGLSAFPDSVQSF